MPSADHPDPCTETVAWVAGQPPARHFSCTVRVRYRQQDVPCEVTLRTDGGAAVVFSGPQRAVTPGQYAVFYDGARCLGGGVISATAAAPDRPAAVYN